MSQSDIRTRITIVIPAYGAAEKLRICLESLQRRVPPGCPVYVLDDATPDDSIRDVCNEAQSNFPSLRYVRSERNRGFVASCNWAAENLRGTGDDLLLLNSDTSVTDGFLEEMSAVLHLHEKHGLVTPRSNSATIFSIPDTDEITTPEESFRIWQEIKHLLPRYQVMPTAVGFCLLIKAEVLDRFGLFDDAYSPGYNEENDLACRINRYGYSAVAANHAFVCHYESSSFGSSRDALELRNRSTLLARYPEYERVVYEYGRYRQDPVEKFASLRIPHRPRLLYDLFHLPDAYTGTSDFGLNLLRALRFYLNEDWDVYVGLRVKQHYFDHELIGYKIYRDRSDDPMLFDLVFKPCQVFSWPEFYRMNRLAPRVSYVLQDIIAVRCEYLNSPHRDTLFRKTAQLSDAVFSISRFSRADFEAYYGVEQPMHIIYHGTNAGMTKREFVTGQYLLVMGNYFIHKGVTEALEQIGERWPTVVLGGEEPPVTGPNLKWMRSGGLSRSAMRSLLVNARMLVYPSYYEGFGLPVADALALGKPVAVLESSVNRELETLMANPNLHLVRTVQELPRVIAEYYEAGGTSAPDLHVRRWNDAAAEYAEHFREIGSRVINVGLLRERWQTLRELDAAEPLEPVPLGLSAGT